MSKIEIVPHASLRDRGEVFETAVAEHLKKGEEKRKTLERSAWRETDQMRQVVESAKTDLSRLYSEAGVAIRPEDFGGRVYFVPATEKNWSSLSLLMAKGHVDNWGHVMVFIEQERLNLYDAVAVHHELHHRLGRLATVIKTTNEPGSGQWGYFTKKGYDIVAERGEVLEEGLVQYLVMEYVMKNHDGVVRQMRNSSQRLVGVLDGWWSREIRDSIKLAYRAASGDGEVDRILIEEKENEEYKWATLLVGLVLDRAETLWGDLGRKAMQGQLLRARVYPKKRRRLVERLNRLFERPKLGRRLFTGQMVMSDLRNLVEEVVMVWEREG